MHHCYSAMKDVKRCRHQKRFGRLPNFYMRSAGNEVQIYKNDDGWKRRLFERANIGLNRGRVKQIICNIQVYLKKLW